LVGHTFLPRQEKVPRAALFAIAGPPMFCQTPTTPWPRSPNVQLGIFQFPFFFLLRRRFWQVMVNGQPDSGWHGVPGQLTPPSRGVKSSYSRAERTVAPTHWSSARLRWGPPKGKLKSSPVEDGTPLSPFPGPSPLRFYPARGFSPISRQARASALTRGTPGPLPQPVDKLARQPSFFFADHATCSFCSCSPACRICFCSFLDGQVSFFPVARR